MTATRNGFERLKPGRVPPRMTMKQKRELMASLRATNKARNEHAESEAKKKQLPAAWQLRTYPSPLPLSLKTSPCCALRFAREFILLCRCNYSSSAP